MIRQRQQSARGLDDERRQARQPRGDGVGQREAVVACVSDLFQLLKRQDGDRVPGSPSGFSLQETFGQDREEPGLLPRRRRRWHRQDLAGKRPGLEIQRPHQGLQRVADLGGEWVAPSRLLGQRSRDDLSQCRRHLRARFRGLGWLVELNRPGELPRVGAREGERMPAGRHLVKDDAEGEDVRLLARAEIDELFGRHIGDRATGLGRAAGWPRVSSRHRPGSLTLGQAEVEDLDQPTFGDHDVGGLQISMQDTQAVRCRQTVGDLDADRQNQIGAHRPPSDQFLEVLARDVLHGDERPSLILAHFIDRADVGVLDG